MFFICFISFFDLIEANATTLTLQETPYDRLPITWEEKEKIGAIVTTMADNHVFKLLFEKKRLERLGQEVNHVHPLRFMGTIFTNPRLIRCMHQIRQSGFKWDGFLTGLSHRMAQEMHAGNVYVYVPGFAASIGMRPESIQHYLEIGDIEGLLLFLLNLSR